MTKPEKKPADALMSISKLAEAAGVTKQQIEYYIMLGLVRETHRTPTGRRKFDQSVVRRLKLIRKLMDSGYSLRHIKEVFLPDQQ